ncbi:conserved hypothetical protein [Histoplasma capsulatum H143]|uniref:Uncharacterized protein n=1 Tax=Ajellomyces capsulatus (strain H143) TaxID=544712 RepID=C6HDW6_AJECH|nr:conserved hypothetical protein [Histoplasma capsulatum H143]
MLRAAIRVAVFIHAHIAKYNLLSTGASQNHKEDFHKEHIISFNSIMASLDSVAQARQDIEQNIPTLDDLYSALTRQNIEQNITSMDDLYRALFQTRRDIEQNITNLVDAIQPLRDAEAIDDIRKYLSDLDTAFCGLSLSFEKLVGFTSCALGMDGKAWELDGFRWHISNLWGDYGHVLQLKYIYSLCRESEDAKLRQCVDYLQKMIGDLQVVCTESTVQLEEDL